MPARCLCSVFHHCPSRLLRFLCLKVLRRSNLKLLPPPAAVANMLSLRPTHRPLSARCLWSLRNTTQWWCMMLCCNWWWNLWQLTPASCISQTASSWSLASRWQPLRTTKRQDSKLGWCQVGSKIWPETVQRVFQCCRGIASRLYVLLHLVAPLWLHHLRLKAWVGSPLFVLCQTAALALLGKHRNNLVLLPRY